MAQEGIISLRCFPSKTDVTVSSIVPVRSAGQFVRLQNSPPFSLSRTNCKASRNFPFRTRFEKRSMTFLRSLIPAKFSEVPHGEVIRVFHELVKPSMIPLVESKQNTLSNLRVIFNALCLSEDNVLKNDHPLSVPLPGTYPVKLYIYRIPVNLFPTFPGRCAS